MAAFWWEAIDGATLACIWGVLCVMIVVLRERRLHDTGHPGMRYRPLSPTECRERERRIAQPSDPGPNRYGPVPPS